MVVPASGRRLMVTLAVDIALADTGPHVVKWKRVRLLVNVITSALQRALFDFNYRLNTVPFVFPPLSERVSHMDKLSQKPQEQQEGENIARHVVEKNAGQFTNKCLDHIWQTVPSRQMSAIDLQLILQNQMSLVRHFTAPKSFVRSNAKFPHIYERGSDPTSHMNWWQQPTKRVHHRLLDEVEDLLLGRSA
jgi:hypothetical protein